MKNADEKKENVVILTEFPGVRPEPKAVGGVIRDFARKYNLKITQLEFALEQANKKREDGWEKRNDEDNDQGSIPLVHNYIYRSWPNITQEATLNIICEAFETLLTKREYPTDVIEDILKALKADIRKLYKKQENQATSNFVNATVLQCFFELKSQEYALFISKYLAAFSSLTASDISFWEDCATWGEEKRKKAFNSWKKYKIDYTTITSPAFRQWMELRSKNYSDSKRKPSKRNGSKLSKKFSTKIQELSSDETTSINYILDKLEERNGSTEGKKYPLAPPIELDLLILFKYFLPNEMKKKYEKQTQMK